MTNISEATQKQVRQRAENRCEYCLSHQNYVMGRLQIDHILPLAKGGKNSLENLCLACELCNQYKWTQTEAIDPQTDQIIALFNPRQQKWIDHFCWSIDGTEIIGKTPCGRATIAALKFNNQLAIIVCSNWVKAGWHPPQIS